MLTLRAFKINETYIRFEIFSDWHYLVRKLNYTRPLSHESKFFKVSV